MLGLNHQVDRGEGGRRPGPRDDDDLGGPGEGGGHPDQPGDLALGLGHVRVARTGDDVDGGHALGAVGQGAHRLGPADPVHLVDARHGGGGQRGVVDAATRVGRGRHAEGDAAHARHLGRGGAHEDGRGVLRSSAGRVDPGSPDRAGQVGDGDTAVDVVGGRHTLVGVVGHDPGEGRLQGIEQRAVHPRRRPLHLLGRDPQPVGDVDPVEEGGAADHGGIPLGLDLAQDRRHGVADVRPGRTGAR